MTKREYSAIIKSLDLKISDFFIAVGRKPNSLGNLKLDEIVPENYIISLNLYKDKLDKDKLLKERALLRKMLDTNICLAKEDLKK